MVFLIKLDLGKPTDQWQLIKENTEILLFNFTTKQDAIYEYIEVKGSPENTLDIMLDDYKTINTVTQQYTYKITCKPDISFTSDVILLSL